MLEGQLNFLRKELLAFFQDHKQKVTIFLQQNQQLSDGSFVRNPSVLSSRAVVPGAIRYQRKPFLNFTGILIRWVSAQRKQNFLTQFQYNHEAKYQPNPWEEQTCRSTLHTFSSTYLFGDLLLGMHTQLGQQNFS